MTTSADAGRDGGRVEAGAPLAAPDAGSASVQVSDAGAEEALPPATSDEMTTRVRHLLEAIAHDNPDLATDMIFPRDAYLAVRDGADPGKAWDNKLTAAFRKTVHALHKKTKGIEKAQYLSFELGHSVEQATPRRHEWKRPVWRVKHSRLVFAIDGKSQHIDIGEMTSWKGAWYITRLR
jgi:hypothetical protein